MYKIVQNPQTFLTGRDCRLLGSRWFLKVGGGRVGLVGGATGVAIGVGMGCGVTEVLLSEEKREGTSRVGEGDGDGVKLTAIGDGACLMYNLHGRSII